MNASYKESVLRLKEKTTQHWFSYCLYDRIVKTFFLQVWYVIMRL